MNVLRVLRSSPLQLLCQSDDGGVIEIRSFVLMRKFVSQFSDTLQIFIHPFRYEI